jgi:hypothetical protein
MSEKNYTFLGAIDTGEAIFYCPAEKSIAIEKDHSHLVEPTAKELGKIIERFPDLKLTAKELGKIYKG